MLRFVSWSSTSFNPKPFSGPNFSPIVVRNFSTKIDDFPKDGWSNISVPIRDKFGRNLHLQKNHPLNIIKKRIENYYLKQNPPFKIFDSLSPFVSVYQNFDSLLIPKDHESRKKTDTYYINEGNVLRCHTSAHQVELLNKGHREFLVFGDVYRRDEIDSSHYPIFHQVEGVKILSEDALKGKNEQEQIAVVEKDLKSSLEGLVESIFGQHLEMRWVDAYFPFTHPSFELEVLFQSKWMEVLGSGVVHQKILQNCNLGDRKGWAFGIGLERLAMALFDIPDIRLFWSQDERFLSQFEDDKITKFKAYSKYPPVVKDVAFWIPEDFHSNNLFEVVRNLAGDLVEDVKLIDQFQNPKTKKTSHCYRITYRSMDRNLTNKEIDVLQENVRKGFIEDLKVEIR